MSLHQEKDAPQSGDADDDLFDAAEDGEDAENEDGDEEGDDPDNDDGEGEEGSRGDEERRSGPSEIEKLAMDAGWKPKGKWKGDGWVPAEQFLKNAAKRASAAKRESRDLQDRLDRLEQSEIKARERAFKQLEAKAREMRREAIAKGGKDAAKLVEEIDDVLAEEKQKLADEQPKPMKLSALDKKFFAENAWMVGEDSFDADSDDAAEADEAYELVVTTIQDAHKKGKTAVEAYELAERALKKAYPHRYRDDDDDEEREDRGKRGKKPSRRAPDLGAGKGRTREDSGDAGGGQMAAKLPPEAKRAGAEYVKRGIYGSLEEYAEVYFEEEGKGRKQ